MIKNKVLILTSCTIDKKLEIYTKLEIELEINKNLEYELEIDKNLENFESNFEFFVNFEFYFEFFVISSFLSMVDELAIRLRILMKSFMHPNVWFNLWVIRLVISSPSTFAVKCNIIPDGNNINYG